MIDPFWPMFQRFSTHDLPHLTYDSTSFDPWFDPNRPMIWSRSAHDSTLFDSWFDPVRLMIRPCSTLSTLFDSWFDPVRLMIWPCSTLSTLFDSWFDATRLYPPWSTHDLKLFVYSIRPSELATKVGHCSTVLVESLVEQLSPGWNYHWEGRNKQNESVGCDKSEWECRQLT